MGVDEPDEVVDPSRRHSDASVGGPVVHADIPIVIGDPPGRENNTGDIASPLVYRLGPENPFIRTGQDCRRMIQIKEGKGRRDGGGNLALSPREVPNRSKVSPATHSRTAYDSLQLARQPDDSLYGS